MTKDTIERFLFKLLLLALLFAAGIGANALGGAIYWFIGAAAIFLVAGFLYVLNVGRLKIKAKDADSLMSNIWGRQFVNLIIISFAFGSGIAAGYLGGGGLWKYAIGFAGGALIGWLFVIGRFRGLAHRMAPDPKKPKKEKQKEKAE